MIAGAPPTTCHPRSAGGRHALCCLMLAMAVGLAGCSPDPRHGEFCVRATELLLGAPGQTILPEPTANDGTRVVFEVRAPDGRIQHRVVCEFAPVTHPSDRPRLRSVLLDAQAIDPQRLIMLGAAVGVPVDLAALVTVDPIRAPPGRWLPYFLQETINAVGFGAVLALVALAYSLVFSLTGTIQFAFGPLYAMGALLTILLTAVGTVLGATPGVGLLVLVIGGAVLPIMALGGWCVDQWVYRPLRGHGRLTPLLAGIGLAILLENGLRLAQGANDKWQQPIFTGRHVLFEQEGFAVTLGDAQVFLLGLTLTLCLVLGWIVQRSRLGRIYRACADDLAMAALLGINVERVIGVASAASAMLAGLAGSLVSVYYGEADAAMGFAIGFKGLAAALLGGFGSLPGAVVGGFAIAFLETFWTAYLGYSYRDVAVLGVLCLWLMVRPGGLFASTQPSA